ncbi:hypothetical protein M5K25_004735 [Dendrobium thyrsiflorum]|uniref:DUF1677 family protein n=1 Tax=Dendrobium thyrsiflorum TaxID=117978 RepID=A0ABD0VGT1_DENTH
MAPKGEVAVSSGGFSAFSRRFGGRTKAQGQSMDGLQRAMSDLSLELKKETIDDARKLPAISEVENANCECCGMSEECTPAYIKRVREKFSGRWICGLCSEAVKEEMEKLGGKKEEAINAHMSVCSKFSRIGRKQPVLYQAQAMREILRRRSSRLGDPKLAAEAAGKKNKGGIMRTSSCIAAITKETNGRLSVN